nr:MULTISPECIES: TRAP transporter substrate-binding protein [Nitratireductor]
MKYALAGLGLLGTTFAANAQTELNIAHVLGETSSYEVASRKLAELVAEKSGGELVINVYNQGALGGELKLTQGLRTGTVDLAFIATASLENTVPELKLFSLPYLFDSHPQALEILGSDVGQELLGTLEPYNMIGLGWGAVYERSTPSIPAIKSVEDLEGTKIRVIQSPGYVATYEAFGAQATPLAYGELFLALQNGIVDAAELAPDQTIGDGFGQVIKNYTLTRVHQLPSMLLASPALKARLSDEEWAMIVEAAPEALDAAIKAHAEATAAGLEEMRKLGITVHEPDLAPFKEKARGSWETVIADIPNGQALVDSIEAAKK